MNGVTSTNSTPVAGVFSGATYEQLLSGSTGWAMDEGSLFFEGKGRVHQALRKIVKRLDALGIHYAIVGGMALVHHGYRRFTDDVDILVTREDLDKLHREVEGLGYLPPFAGSKHLRDTELSVKIEFLTTGEFPGDGKPKPVAFPEPSSVAENDEGICYVRLPELITLKLASGMTNTGRLKDLADVQELIKLKKLPRNFGNDLPEYVRPKFLEIWDNTSSEEET
jgi:hypothetical protein